MHPSLRYAHKGVAALALWLGCVISHAQDRQPTSPLPFPFPLPTIPGTVPFIPIGPQPEAVTPNSEGWQSVVKQFGSPMSGRQADMLAGIVAELSRVAGAVAPKGGYRSTLIDTSVLNALAIPDGHVFLTRQLLAYFNDEDELIGVMGHEIGHVIGGHSRFKMAAHTGRAKSDQLLGVFLPPLRDVVQVGSTVAIQAFGRSQEHSADVAGVKFLADQGRDPMAMARALTILEADEQLQRRMFGASPPGALDYWLRSHPQHSERVALVQAAASMAPRGRPGPRRSREAFIRGLDGLVFDDSPEQGIVDGSRFRHPTMKLALDAGPGFRLINTPSALALRPPTGGSATLKPLSGGGPLPDRFKSAWAKSFPAEISAPTAEQLQFNGLAVAHGSVERKVGETPVRISMWLYAWSDSESLIYVALDPRGANSDLHAATARSLRRMSDDESATVKVRRLSVVDIASTDTVASLSQRMAYDDFREERFRLINGLTAGQPLPKAGPIKLVIWSPQQLPVSGR